LTFAPLSGRSTQLTPKYWNLIMDDMTQAVPVADSNDKPEWCKPELTASAPVQAAEGISYRPNDGLSNLS
jgi:hypothetical protein